MMREAYGALVVIVAAGTAPLWAPVLFAIGDALTRRGGGR